MWFYKITAKILTSDKTVGDAVCEWESPTKLVFPLEEALDKIWSIGKLRIPGRHITSLSHEIIEEINTKPKKSKL